MRHIFPACPSSVFLIFTVILTACTTIQSSENDGSLVSSSAISITTTAQESNQDSIRKKLIDALVNDRLQFSIISEAGGRSACEPQEPYFTLKVRRRRTEQYLADLNAPDGGHMETRQIWEDMDLGQGITFDEKSGVRVMDVRLD